jgi:putative ABC transport system permease protein
MWRNYLKVALRNLQRQKGFTFINVAGLAVGMACCVLILLYVQDERSYDRHHAKADRIYRLTALDEEEGLQWAPIGPPVGAALKSAIPEVEEVTRFFPFGESTIFQYGDQQFEEQGGLYADSTVFDVFTIPMVDGQAETALNRPRTIVLTETMARKYFGGADPLGQVLTIPGWMELTVTGVVQDPPPSTHLPFNFLVSMQTFYDNAGDWVDGARTWSGFYTYILLEGTEDEATLEAKLPAFVDQFFDGIFDGPASERMSAVLQPVRDIHLHSQIEKEYRANSDIRYIYVFSVVALFVLLIACINFINLSTARAAQRMREVGVRKVLGAQRGQLGRQFLGESMLMALLAFVLGSFLIVLGLPGFNALTGKALTMQELLRPDLLLGLLGLTLFVGLLSGSYPALVLSRLRPTRALQGHGGPAVRAARLRQGLVVFQFAVSIFLIAGSIVIMRQLDFFRNKQLGFDKEHVVKVMLVGELYDAVENNLDSFKEELLRSPLVERVSFASDVPGERYSLEGFTVDGQQDDESTMMRIAWGVDHDYAATLGLTLAEGRDFSKEAPADTNAWLLNESAVARLGLEEPVGRVLRWGDNYAGPIVGVVRDFHFASLHNQIEPLVIPLRPGVGGQLLVRLRGGQPAEAIDFIHRQLDRLVPNQIFNYAFVGDNFDALYRDEDKLRDVFGYFTGVAVFIACLGLFGLAAFTAERRTKEIGVRKVLGATVGSLVFLLAKEFLKLVCIAFVVAAPLAYLGMDRWLQGFAYRADVSGGAFLLAGLGALGIALLTVSYQAVRAARANPVDTLRYE